MHDAIVIGAGLGGLTTAAILARAGRDVLLLEAHDVPGGCASYFADRKFLFDVGATTLSGLGEVQPITQLLSRLDLELPMRHCDPGMIIHATGARISRWVDHECWIAECERAFGAAGQRAFWTRIHHIARRSWSASARIGTALPMEWKRPTLHALGGALRHAGLLRWMFRSVSDEARAAGLGGHSAFEAFLREQLMITTQSTPEETPVFAGAMGLEYPSDTWYVDGGMNALPRALLRAFRANGGQYHRGARVTGVHANGGFVVRTADGGEYRSRAVISNLTVWDTMSIMQGRLNSLRTGHTATACQGAVTVYAGVEEAFDDHGCCYHQILLDTPLPWSCGHSLFVSLSHRSDRGRAPAGHRTVTVSTHVADTTEWLRIDEHEYGLRKRALAAEIERCLAAALPGYETSGKPVRHIGTPRTFVRYTGRHRGWVGGIPHSTRRPIIAWQGHRTRMPGLHLVGDTVYPGQGAPAVVLGAMNLADDMLESR